VLGPSARSSDEKSRGPSRRASICSRQALDDGRARAGGPRGAPVQARTMSRTATRSLIWEYRTDLGPFDLEASIVFPRVVDDANSASLAGRALAMPWCCVSERSALHTLCGRGASLRLYARNHSPRRSGRPSADAPADWPPWRGVGSSCNQQPTAKAWIFTSTARVAADSREVIDHSHSRRGDPEQPRACSATAENGFELPAIDNLRCG